MPTISPYEAPALIDMHGSLTRLELYERLSASKAEDISPGLSAAIQGPILEMACQKNGWKKPIRGDSRFALEGCDRLEGYAPGWKSEDDQGQFSLMFVHVAAYVFSSTWRRAGMPPEDYQIQAQWTAMGNNTERLAVVALSDKSIEIFWIDADPEMQARLLAAASDMEKRIDANDPPPIDAVPQTEEADSNDGTDEEDVDLDKAVATWREAKLDRATIRNKTQFADERYERAEKALVSALKPGGSHEYDGFRVIRNAKTDKLTEEKIDGTYF